MNRNPLSKNENQGKKIHESCGDFKSRDDISLEAAGLAHDLNNVLATISGYAELMREDLPAGSPLREDANKVISGVIRARLLTDELLTLGKYSGHGQKETDVAGILNESIEFLTSLQPRNILVEKNIPEITAVVNCEPVKLFRVFLNIIKNAFQSMEKAGGKLSAGLYLPSPEQLENMLADIKRKRNETENAFYEKSDKKNFVVIFFRDTGSGIDSSVIDRIYDPYFTQRDKPGGTGLGLTVVRKIVTELDGDIIVTSHRGIGTEFQILLPLAP